MDLKKWLLASVSLLAIPAIGAEDLSISTVITSDRKSIEFHVENPNLGPQRCSRISSKLKYVSAAGAELGLAEAVYRDAFIPGKSTSIFAPSPSEVVKVILANDPSARVASIADPSQNCEDVAANAAVGTHMLCYVLKGEIWCWGGSYYTPPDVPAHIAYKVPYLSEVSQVTMGLYHTCALSQGKVYCWGDNSYGQLGDGSKVSQSSPVRVSGINNATSLVSGHYHNCVTNAKAEVMCWGANTDGAIGDESISEALTPVKVKGLGKVKKLVAGLTTTCVVLDNGDLWCWGSGAFSTNGSPSTRQPVPTKIQGLAAVTDVAVSGGAGCVIAAGKLKCWSYQAALSEKPQIADPLGLVMIDYGIVYVRTQEEIYTWDASSDIGEPQLVEGIDRADLISGSNGTTCALDSGELYCWGFDIAKISANNYLDSPTKHPTKPGEVITPVPPSQEWQVGSWNCLIDGRPATMAWETKDRGVFSDSGGPLFILTKSFWTITSMQFHYSGDNTQWFLEYNPRNKSATGNTIWEGNPYPLSCIKN